MADVREILELEVPSQAETVTKEAILGNAEKQKKKLLLQQKMPKRPEGMHREVFALLYNDNKDAPPLFPTDTGQGYKQLKAKLGMRKVRPWKWMPFTNPARKDGAVFYHWRRVADEGKEYPFAKFNKQAPIPSYSDAQYQQHLQSESWSRAETDHLFDLARRFDLRFGVMRDRWDSARFPDRNIEDLKERYYNVCTLLTKIKGVTEGKLYVFDADHERRRKEQLKRLYERTPEQVEEEQNLLNELRKIEARKKERDKKAQDLQKLITAADNQGDQRKMERKIPRKKLQQARPRVDTTIVETAGIKFPDMKTSGVFVRSQKMKLPANVGQKKMKAIEQMLQDLNIELNPMPTENICHHFNELRSDLVLLYELKSALATCEFELQTLRHRYEAFNPGKTLVIPPSLFGESQNNPLESSRKALSSETIDVVGSPNISSSFRLSSLE
ncbi:DNA methyltransferase 1-associated protein 1-like [Macrosteles quadrilineatus]|uniref:DNA methyltransferase 1-associated protein 1-like n=1 Tax=Macrosteles quadrilineatus TaxID=74068 RepID=UPI0023E0F7B0|nr:DNA methyltransferase 1-associated protein 1-like [Macrosteles quadrilineatus]